MGNGELNTELRKHLQPSDTEPEFYVWLHLGMIQLDTRSILITEAQHDDLVTEAAISQVAFDTEADIAFGKWYTNQPAKYRPGQSATTKATIRELFK